MADFFPPPCLFKPPYLLERFRVQEKKTFILQLFSWILWGMSLMSIDNLNAVDHRTKLYFTFLGEVKYIGEVHFKPGMWVGIQYDEPFGKNDGSVEEKRYFQCQPKYGGFVRVANVTVGDFPEEGFSDDEI